MMNLPYRLILGSKSPRRQELLKNLGFDFEVRVRPVDETFPTHLEATQMAEFIARKKAEAFDDLLASELVITSDTVVICDGRALAKPANRNDAKTMLQALSGNSHQVITAVCLKTQNKITSFSESTLVYFDVLESAEIDHYIDLYKPFDKAGAYGIQEWIGMIGIHKIEGDYYNVMGLPLHRLYKTLRSFTSQV